MKTLIIEDEDIAARRLKSLVQDIAPEFEILGRVSSVESGRNWFSNNPMPDLIFLDIQLNDGYGFDILDDLEEHPPVIFTTAYNEYAIRGFKYNGVDYLLKPIDKQDLKKALEKYSRTQVEKEAPKQQSETVKSIFHKEYKRRFMVKVGNQFKSINVENIAYFMAESGLVFLYTNDENKSPIEYSIDQLEEILDPINFFRINRKYLVSVDAVREIHTYFNSRLLIKLSPAQEENVIVARERTTKFKNWLDL